ncbi:pyruvate synthase subunit PorC [Clostridium tepidiprofundi DSM 19306]|uniref:Pyruvate synthase subunit PorC n=1 Tax=Clostridium tepidiprofundi DSM 19306 TaxID=1121338 RepID=A0A151B3V7_9CLOT|nr:2-oxoacid:acceptor oxidoreductase family protein [Clostridium tepidiprofundi]KYH34601.1 pyruvate synthase subunit PorC [Clostridium tepidiprofundi DSM 19306]
MVEIRWHGRGGQGGFTAARILGTAAAVYNGKYAQAFPSFGPERRGAPVLGFTRIDDKKITDRSEVYNCDYAIVLDETLMGQAVTNGLKKDSVILINTQNAEKYKQMTNNRIIAIDATSLALEILGRPITNTAMMGALIAVSGVVDIEAAKKAIESNMRPSIAEKNKILIEKAYEITKGVLENE